MSQKKDLIHCLRGHLRLNTRRMHRITETKHFHKYILYLLQLPAFSKIFSDISKTNSQHIFLFVNYSLLFVTIAAIISSYKLINYFISNINIYFIGLRSLSLLSSTSISPTFLSHWLRFFLSSLFKI